MKDALKVKLMAIKSRYDSRRGMVDMMRRNDDGEAFTWITTENGHKIPLDENGNIAGGNPHVVAVMKGGEKKGSNREKGSSNKSGSSKSKSASKGVTFTNKNGKTFNTTTTQGGVKYPELKDGTEFLEALAIAESTALEDEESGAIPKGTFDKVVSSLTSDDIVYQKDATGKEFASIPLLASMVDNATKAGGEMQSVFDKAFEEGKVITRDMFAAAGTAGMYLSGTENAVKGASHIEEKAGRKLGDFIKATGNPDATEVDVAKSFGDLVRYTATTSNGNIVEGTKSMIRSLEESGYEVVEVDNKFLNKDGTPNENATYRAVHLTARSADGRDIEVQIHSEESLSVKGMNHGYYEEERSLKSKEEESPTEKGQARLAELRKIQIQNWKDHYSNPDGIETLESYDHRKK